jgi:hypothetical protein
MQKELSAVNKTKGSTTIRTPSMIKKKTGLMDKIVRNIDLYTPRFYMELHCSVHQQSFCGKF